MGAPARKNMVLFVTTLSSFLNPFMSSAINVALPVVGREFHMDAILLGWVSTSFLLSSAMFLVPFGRIADIHGRKRIFNYGMIVFTLSTFLCGVSFSSWSLIAFRVVQGVGSTMVFATAVAILTSVFPPEERGKALGINVTGVYSGILIGPFAGGILTHFMGWRSLFFATIVICMLIIPLALYTFPDESTESHGEKMDYPGMLLYCISLPLVMYGFSALPGTAGFAMIAAGSAIFALFVFIESRERFPLVAVSIFKNRVFALSNLASLINYSATFAITFLISLYLQYIKGMTPQYAGMVLIAQPVMMVLFSSMAGALSDRIEPRLIASAGMGLATVGLFFLAFIDAGTSVGRIVFVLACIGLGFALFSSPITNAVMGSVEKRHYGLASAVIGTMRLFGMMLSMGVIMIVFSVFIGRVSITPAIYPAFLKSLRVIFIISTALCLCGIVPSLVREKR